MRIRCPFCGERDLSEFACLGAAGQSRPEPTSPDHEREFFEFVYIRDNPAGPHQELWYHAFGCRTWLHVTRDTHSHNISSVTFARRSERS